MTEVTRILSAIKQGDPQASDQLLPLVYDELRRLAAQKMAQDALRVSEERLRAVLDASNDGFWERDLVTGKVMHSARMNEILGFPAATIASMRSMLRVPVESVRIILGDTDVVRLGGGSHSPDGSRTAPTRWQRASPSITSGRDCSAKVSCAPFPTSACAARSSMRGRARW